MDFNFYAVKSIIPKNFQNPEKMFKKEYKFVDKVV